MNTDASNVEDVNILHITECLSLSFVASFEDWFCLFRTRSFTLCKYDLDFNDMSDSATVLRVFIIGFNNEICPCAVQTVWLFINKSLRSYFHQFIRIPLLRRPNLINIPFWVAWWVSVFNKSHRSLMLLSPRAQRFLKHVRILFAASRDQKHIGFDFAVTLSSPESFCVLFDITSEQLVELKWLMFKKTRTMIPFITCEVSLGQCVCELVFGVNVFDLDFCSPN